MLNKKQVEIFRFISHYIFKNNIAPTEREISEHVNIKSRGVIHRHIKKISGARLITITGKKRGIRLVKPRQYMQLPIVEDIAGGCPLGKLTEVKVLDLADLIVGSHRFVLCVKGSAMIGDNICNSDYIVCEKKSVVKDNEISVVLINEVEVALKRVQNNDDGTVTLLALSSEAEPRVYAEHEVKIQGVYLGLIRLNAQGK